MIIRVILLSATGLLLSACGSTNSMLAKETRTIEHYHIFDIQTSAKKTAVYDAAETGLKRNVNDARTTRPLQMGRKIPETPGRFEIVDPLAGSQYSGLAASQGVSIKTATCNEAVWTAYAERRVDNAQRMRINACLYPYTKGYHLNIYMANEVEEGGLLDNMITRGIQSSIAGSPEEWAEKTVIDMVKEIEKTVGAKVTYIEGEPEFDGQPWHAE